MRIELLGDDNGRTTITLDIDTEKVKVIDPHTIEVIPPPGWENDTPTPIDALLVLTFLYHSPDWLDHMGVTVVAIVEDGVTLENPGASIQRVNRIEK